MCYRYSVPPKAVLKVDTLKLDFGIQVNEHQVATKYFNITNSGDLEGYFSLQSNMPSCLTVHPREGKVKPKQIQKIRVDLLCNLIEDIEEFIRLVI